MKNLIVNTIIIIAIMIALGIIAINYINKAANPYTEICVKSEKTSELTQ